MAVVFGVIRSVPLPWVDPDPICMGTLGHDRVVANQSPDCEFWRGRVGMKVRGGVRAFMPQRGNR